VTVFHFDAGNKSLALHIALAFLAAKFQLLALSGVFQWSLLYVTSEEA
jgi:hypothetical protein